MLRLPDSWIWDFWTADTGTEFHLFFLRASRALGDPRHRHLRASVGHAVSTDLQDWTLLPDAIVPSDAPGWDDLAIWTGCVVADAGGLWRMFYTGLSQADRGMVQRIGVATSTDLITWRTSSSPVVESDPQWYEQLADGLHNHVAWRDPWVYADPDGNGWHMILTARANKGAPDDRGVLGYAWSSDLDTWTAGPPRTAPGAGFGQLEVPQVVRVDGRNALIFSCLCDDTAGARRQRGEGGSWSVAVADLEGPWNVRAAQLLVDDRYYSTRLVQDRMQQWHALAFHNREADGTFDGRISDPMHVSWNATGGLSVS